MRCGYRQAQDAAYRLIHALAHDLPGYEGAASTPTGQVDTE
jgi:hypothetical protein